jgi:tRNA (guanine-N7-)-methyltransferase
MRNVDESQRNRPIRSFVIRAARMSDAQTAAIEEHFPRYGVPYAPQAFDASAVFGRAAPLIVEIGFGMGIATAEIAYAAPDKNFLGIEVHPPGVGNLLKVIASEGLSNLRIARHDAVEVLTHMLAPDSVDGFHIYFPDPWHKKRHHKRRLIQPPFVQRLAQCLRPGGYVHMATDWEDYAQVMLEVLSAEPTLRNTAEGFAPKPAWRPTTKFETRGVNLGHGVWDLMFVKV